MLSLSVPTQVVRSGELFSLSDVFFRIDICSATAIADKLGIEFALILRHKKGENGPDRVHVLVGDVRDKVQLPNLYYPSTISLIFGARLQYS